MMNDVLSKSLSRPIPERDNHIFRPTHSLFSSFLTRLSLVRSFSCFFSSGFWSLTYFFLLAALSFMKWDTLARKKERKNNMPKESCWKFIWIFWEPTLLFEKRNRCLEAYCKRYALWNSVKFSIHTKFVDSHFLCLFVGAVSLDGIQGCVYEPVKERERCTTVPWTLPYW